MFRFFYLIMILVFISACNSASDSRSLMRVTEDLEHWQKDSSAFGTYFLSDSTAEAQHFICAIPPGADTTANCVFFLAPANARFHLWLNDSLLIDTRDMSPFWPANGSDQIMVYPCSGNLRPYVINAERWKTMRRRGAGQLRVLIITSDDSNLWGKAAVFAGSRIDAQASCLPDMNAQVFVPGKLPLMNLDPGTELDFNTGYQRCMLEFSFPDENGEHLSDQKFDAEFRQRGYSSTTFPKRQFSLHVLNKEGSKRKTSLLGMPAASNWILQGPYADRSLIRNAFVCDLWKEMGYWSPQQKFVEAVINRNYMGVYVCCQRPEAITDDAGQQVFALLQNDRLHKNDRIIHANGYPFIVEKLNRSDAYTTEKLESLMSAWILEVLSKEDIPQSMDINSFVDFFLLQELTKNVDAYSYSTFTSIKNENQPMICAGPVWDFDRALGGSLTRNGLSSDGWMMDSLNAWNSFWPHLANKTYFKNLCRERYLHWRMDTWSDDHLQHKLDSLTAMIGEDAISRDRYAFPMSSKFASNHALVSMSHVQEIDYIREWLLKRLKWMDEQFNSSTAR